MESSNFTRQAIEAMEYAKEVAISFGNELYRNGTFFGRHCKKYTEGVAANILYNYNLVYADIMKAISEDMGIKTRAKKYNVFKQAEIWKATAGIPQKAEHILWKELILM